jgi:indolepyruvate ferredoxin oxidoreductase beta subunit
MNERIALADGRVDEKAMLQSCREAAHKLHAFDMAALADATGSLVSAVLFGALAGSGKLPFPRPAFEATIRRGGVGVQPSLMAFGAGFEAATGGEAKAAPAPQSATPPDRTSSVQSLLNAFEGPLSALSRPLVTAGLERLIDYQDQDYARLYLERLAPFARMERGRGGAPDELLAEVARQLALAMAYEDTIRVAELKIRASRFARVRDEVGVKDGQLLEIAEFMHPRTQEIAETLPAPLGRMILNAGWIRALVDRMTRSGRIVKTTSLRGFLLLYLVSSLKPIRRRSLRYLDEQERLASWLAVVADTARQSYELAVGAARIRELVKGYGDTHERGRARFDAIIALLPQLAARPDGAAVAEHLRKAAVQDEKGEVLKRVIAEQNLSLK